MTMKEEGMKLDNISIKKVEEAICAMVLGVNAPDEILIECQKYLRKELGFKELGEVK